MVPMVTALATVLGAIVVALGMVRREALTIVGLGLVCASAWTYATWSGLLVTGLAVLWLEYLTSPTEEPAK